MEGWAGRRCDWRKPRPVFWSRWEARVFVTDSGVQILIFAVFQFSALLDALVSEIRRTGACELF